MNTSVAFRLLVVDVDGTLFDRSFQVHPRVRRALAAVRDRGIAVALCTGRPLESCLPIIADLDLTGPHIVCDGALVYDPAERRSIFRCPPDAHALTNLVGYAREHESCFELYTDDHVHIERPWEESALHARLVRVQPLIANFDRLIEEGGVIKGQFITSDPTRRKRVEEAAEIFRHRLRFSWAKPPPGYEGIDFINVVHPSVSKGDALAALAAHYGVDLDRVVAVGDGPNDITLLRAAGLGIAMGNATGEVKAVAKAVTASVEEGGLADAIERYLLG